LPLRNKGGRELPVVIGKMLFIYIREKKSINKQLTRLADLLTLAPIRRFSLYPSCFLAATAATAATALISLSFSLATEKSGTGNRGNRGRVAAAKLSRLANSTFGSQWNGQRLKIAKVTAGIVRVSRPQPVRRTPPVLPWRGIGRRPRTALSAPAVRSSTQSRERLSGCQKNRVRPASGAQLMRKPGARTLRTKSINLINLSTGLW
jgi:hypothetical protein